MDTLLRHADSHREKARLPSPPCQLQGCSKRTRERKPFCSEHVELHPYAQKIKKALRDRDAELERVERSGIRHVDLGGMTAQEIVLQLRLHGTRTVPRLARDLVIPESVMQHFVRALRRRGVVSVGRTPRGILSVTLVNAGLLLRHRKKASKESAA